MRFLTVAAAILAVAGSARAASSVVQYGPAPAWVSSPPALTGTPPPDGAAVQILFLDTQVRLGVDGDEIYGAYRLKILKPEALAVGNITGVWNPSADDIRVHRLKIIRDGREIDVLAANRFKVIQREDNLEISVLAGNLTASLQTPGLQVGDELEFAFTVKRRDPTLGDRSQGAMQAPAVGAAGVYRLRLVWPKSRGVHWRASSDIGQAKPVELGGDYAVNYELRDPKTAILTDGAPARFNIRRQLQFSTFTSWQDVSNTLSPIFQTAAMLAPSSPIKAEAAKIAAASTDPTLRAEAALRLVQERIRYVYVGMDGANYRPATADQTWDRRFGDCKGKTVVLLALLRELGIPAEPALVDAAGGDGIDERLPMPGVFDHVVVRASIAGQTYWLDGTRLGDRTLDLLPAPPFVWALPLRGGAVTLERVPRVAPVLVQAGELIQVDARKGFDVPAKVSAEQILREDAALQLRLQLAQMSKVDAERVMRAYWTNEMSWVEPETVAWRYDESQNLLALTMAGEGKPAWEGDDKQGRRLDVYNAGFSPPAPLRRPKEQDQTAPWLTEFPLYKRWTTVIRLPHSDTKAWRYQASDMDVRMGGVAYWRQGAMVGDVLRTTMSRRVLRPEISAEEARDANTQLATFDNKIAIVFQYEKDTKSLHDQMTSLLAQAGVDADMLANKAMYLQEIGQEAEAKRAIDKALAIDPKSIVVLMCKLDMLNFQGDATRTLAFADKAVAANASRQLAMVRARALIKVGKMDEGFAAMDAILKKDPENFDLLADYAMHAREVGRSDRALEAASSAIKLDPSKVMLWRLRSAIYVDQGRYAQALVDLDESVRLEPEGDGNLRNRAAVLSRMGRAEAALADIDEALRMDPLDGSIVATKANILTRAGRGREAVAVYDDAVEIERNANSLNNRCWGRALANLDLPAAEIDCAEAVKLQPKQAGYWDSYALIALRLGRLDDAMNRYGQALALNPKLAAALYGRGVTRLRRGDQTGGREDIAAARSLSPHVGDDLEDAGIAPRPTASTP